MFNFLTIPKTFATRHSPCTTEIYLLYKRYEKYLHDDYTPPMTYKNFLDFICGNEFFHLIKETATNKTAGFVFLDNITGSPKSLHSAEITTCFEKNFWGNKTHLCAMEYFNYIFNQYGFYKIKAQIYPQNFRVKTLLKKCGFIFEGKLKCETLSQDKLQDIEMYSLINKKKCEDTNEN